MASFIQEPLPRSIYLRRIEPAPICVVVYWLLMLVMGTDVIDASLLAVAMAFGFMSVAVVGGFKTAPGLLNFVLLFKFLLVALAVKTITLQAADSNLRAPRTTSEVMAVGFLALYLGSLLFQHSVKVRGLVSDVTDSRMYLALTIVFSIACLGSSFVVLIFQTSYSVTLAGGFWGIAHQFETAEGFCVVPAMYYAWSSGSRRFLSHPLVLIILAAELAFGVASTTKQSMMEPLMCYAAVGFIRLGLGNKTMWTLIASGGFLYISIFYPYSQYVRSHGGRDGTLAARLEVIREVFFNLTTDVDFRDAVDSRISMGDTYLGKDSLQPISRLAMIGEADRLIAATDATQSYTGWDTISNGFYLMVPSFLMGDKPLSGGGNYLGHIAGDLAPDDNETQVSYGFMANLYNAFGLPGVFIGTVLFMFSFFYMLRLWFDAQTLTFMPFGSTVWYLLIGTLFEHGLIEASIGNQLPAYVNLVAIVGLVFISKFLTSFFSAKYIGH
jgi:hypothetical protein